MILDDSAMAYDLHLIYLSLFRAAQERGGRGRWEREGLNEEGKRGYTFFWWDLYIIQRIRGQEK